MQTTTEQDICVLLKGLAISCMRKRNLDKDSLRHGTRKILEEKEFNTSTSMVTWFKILNDLGYDVNIYIKGYGDNPSEGCLFVKIDDQEF